MPFQPSSLRRLWQPRRGLFWVMLAFNLLSSALVWYVHLAQPAEGLRLGWWVAVRLWREGGAR